MGAPPGGGRSDLSEWQRSTDAKEHRRRRQMSGTATVRRTNHIESNRGRQKKPLYFRKEVFFNDVCLAANDDASLMMFTS